MRNIRFALIFPPTQPKTRIHFTTWVRVMLLLILLLNFLSTSPFYLFRTVWFCCFSYQKGYYPLKYYISEQPFVSMRVQTRFHKVHWGANQKDRQQLQRISLLVSL